MKNKVIKILKTTALTALSAILLFPSSVVATEVEEMPSDVVEVETEVSVPDINYNPDPNRWPSGPAVESESAVVMELDTGTIVYNKAGTVSHYPASITKIMTALVALERSSLDEMVTFSANAVYSIEKGSSSISRDVDEQMTMEECIYALLLESANEVANAIAEHVAGDISSFSELMNEKARELGCVNTHFANANGLHDDNHYTCAYDMALIAQAAYKNPTFALICGTKQYMIPPTNKHEEVTPLNNHHAMLNYYKTNKYLYEFCVGGKTGYTSKALSTLVTYGKKDGKTLAVVTMCVPGSGHYLDTRALLDFFFDNLQLTSVSELNLKVNEVADDTISTMLSRDEVPYKVDENAVLTLPKDADKDAITSSLLLNPAPQNGIIGNIEYQYGGLVAGSSDIFEVEVLPFRFKNQKMEDEQIETEEKPVLINVMYIIAGVIAAAILIVVIVLVTMKLKTTATTVRRKRIENRDPHKNLRRIKRRRKRRNNRGM